MFEYRVMIDQKLGLALVFGFLVLIEKPWFFDLRFTTPVVGKSVHFMLEVIQHIYHQIFVKRMA